MHARSTVELYEAALKRSRTLPRALLWAAIGFLTVVTLSLPVKSFAVEQAGDNGYWQGVAAELTSLFDLTAEVAQNGDAKAAKRHLTEAYFGVFEGRKMEAAIRKTFGKDRAYEIERGFADARRLIKTGSGADIRAAFDALAKMIVQDGAVLDAKQVSKDVYDVR